MPNPNTPRMTVREILIHLTGHCFHKGDYQACGYEWIDEGVGVNNDILKAEAAIETLLNEREVAARIDELNRCKRIVLDNWVTNDQVASIEKHISELSDRLKKGVDHE